MDGHELTPAQRAVVDDLFGRGEERPRFEPTIATDLIDLLEDALAPVAAHLEDAGPAASLSLNKTALSRLHACEAHWLATVDEPFEWSLPSCRGAIVHKAIELSIFGRPDEPPMALVDAAIERLRDAGDEWSPSSYLLGASDADLAALRAEATAAVTTFQQTFPPIEPRWRPRTEVPCRVSLCADRVVLRSKVDLAFGRARGTEAHVLLLDVKTGRPYPTHLDDLRFYALLETIRSSVPPYRIASYYVEQGRWRHEDVGVDLLEAAALRTASGVRKAAELRLGLRRPDITSGPACGHCPLRDACAGAAQWRERRDEANALA